MNTTDLAWFKSSYSGDDSGDCVEIATGPTTTHIRDSKNTTGPQLTVSPSAWTDFVGFVELAASGLE